MSRRLVSLAAGFVLLSSAAAAQGTRLLRHPAINGNVIAFEYGGDLWVATRSGGPARRLTSTPDVETEPRFSPDGSHIAFSRTSNGNTDVYVVPTAGGEPTRLTFHPGNDRVRGWTPDGKRVVFASERVSAPQSSYFRMFTVPAAGGFEEVLPMPRAFSGVHSPDGTRVAYEEISTAFIPDWYEASMWRHYRGGRTHPISVIDLATCAVEKLPWQNSNDSDPMWVGNTVYFLSDRNYTRNLFSYDLSTKKLEQLTRHNDADVMTASAGSDAIVYEQNGFIHLYDIKSGQSKQLAIDVVGDFPWSRPQFKRVASMIRDASLSPTGVRAAFEARGDIFTVPADKGDWRNLTKSPGTHDRNPVWSPDGGQLAWISDAKGDDQLMIADQSGLSTPRAVPLPGSGFFSELEWSPNGKSLLVDDNHLNLWTIDVASGKAAKLDEDLYNTPGRSFDATWSSDSRWVAYTKSLDSHMRAVFVRSLAEPQSRQLTDALADAVSPAFDASGKYLYFLASTDYGPRSGWVEMSAVDRPSKRSVYLAVLNANDPSPLLPETGDEPSGPAAPRAKADSVLHVDFANIGQRILSLDVPAADYGQLAAGPAGTIFYSETVTEGSGRATTRLQRYQLRVPGNPAPGGASTFLDGIRSFTLSADRKKLLYAAGVGTGARWGIVATTGPAKVGDGVINVAALESWVDPRAEWAEIFHEGLRQQREFFYDAKLHGADWKAVEAKYEPLVAFVNHRADLGYLMAQTGGELVVGHSYLLGPGDVPSDPPVSVGLLGADYTVENGHYRLHRVYTGENWNPDLRAPLSAPGIDVKEGDYLLEVNGRPIAPPTNVYSLFEGTAGHQIAIRVNGAPTNEGSRVVTVVPVASEDGLRTRAWIEDNRRKVDELSHGRLAYVWLPNTTIPGYQAFTRYFYSQQGKDGAIIDERYNHGGLVADYIVNELDRKPMGYFAMRDGKTFTTPAAGIYGLKVMIVNESAGSGGDALPYYFQMRHIGPLVGTRTWGALVGTTGTPPTIDGGGITAPSLAFYDMNGHWAVENQGVTPEFQVEYSAAEVSKGHDPQLERAVQEALKLLDQHPVTRVARPAPIDRVKPPTR
ncbi:MAG TPA: PDZ domain-containing protein [Gemmatimonadaceae bacterium]|nr:PDZ domain-containing protein [Gemmatimonadaceae bacterium]